MTHPATPPDVTLLMPCYNAEETLAECLDSIQCQTFASFELLAVDDGSQDGSTRIILDRQSRDARIRLLSPGRVGLVRALNLGLAAARTPLVARMDADDIMAPERLEKQWDFLHAHPDIALVGCQVRLFPEAYIRDGFREYVRWQNRCLTPEDMADEIYWESPLAHPSVMFRKAVVEAVGGYREGDFPEDYELWLRMNQAGLRLAKVAEVLLAWRDHATRLTRTDPRYARLAFDILRARFLAQDPRLASDRPLVIWGAGRHTRKRARHLLERGFRNTAWVDVDPNKIGHMVHGVPVVPPSWLLNRSPRPFVLSYVVKHGAQSEIRQALTAMDYLRGRDFLMVA